MNKTLIIWYFLLLGSLCVMARRRKVLKLHKTPLYRSLEPHITSTEAEEDEIEVPKVPTKAKLFVIKPRNYDDNDEGRFLKHILLYKSFMQPQTNRPGNRMPYLIINNPLNLTNINNNTLNNVPQTGTTTAGVTGTGTGGGTGNGGTGGGGTGGGGTGGGAGGGGNGGAGDGGVGDGDVRIGYIRDSQALPYALPMPMFSQIYQQRQQPMPQVVYGVPLGNINQNKRRRNRYGNANANANKYVYQNQKKRNTNPFSTFANSLRRVQFL